MKSRKWKKRIREAKAGKALEQAAALPFRFANGALEVMLITTRTTHRFCLPKGWPMGNRSLSEVARIEAFEEAGIEGKVSSATLGVYFYWKRLKKVFIPIKVSVFPLEVTCEIAHWPEGAERQRKWLPSEDAALLIDEPELVSLLCSLYDKIKRDPTRGEK